MIRIILIGAATVFIICLVAAAVISVFLAIRIGEEIKDEEHKSFTCYLSGRACVTPHLPCEACRIFAERMQPEQEEPEPLPEEEEDEEGGGGDPELAEHLRREVSGMMQEPLMQTQEPPLGTQDPALHLQEPPIAPEFIDAEERSTEDQLIAETGPFICSVEEKPLPDAGPRSRIPQEPWQAGKEVAFCALKNGACRLPDLGGDPCLACFFLHDGEMLPAGTKDKETTKAK